MPGPLAHRGGGNGPPRPPPLPRRPVVVPALRRFPERSLPIDHASALPPDAVRVLRLVAAGLRDMPRDCATDRRELVHWLSRLARRLDALAASKARPASPAPPCPRPRPETPPAGAAEAVAAIPAPIGPAPPAPRPRPARHMQLWRAVPIAASARRRAEAAGQLDLFR